MITSKSEMLKQQNCEKNTDNLGNSSFSDLRFFDKTNGCLQ